MTDLSQPASAAEFISAGVDPATAANLAAQANLMAGRGSSDEVIAMRQGVANLPPPIKPAPPQPTATQADAQAALEAHTESQLAEQLAKDFAPPANAYEYRIPGAPGATDADLAADAALAKDFHTEGLPKFIVDNIGASLEQSARTLGSETTEQRDSRIATNTLSLDRMWGADKGANLAVIDSFLEQLQARSPAMSEFIARAAPMLTPLDLNAIVEFAKFRARGRS